MNVAVLGYCNSMNAGDDRLQYCITRMLKPEHNVVFLPHQDEPSTSYLRRFDYLLIGGGGLVFERHGIWKNVRQWTSRVGRPIGVIGLGVNRLDDELAAELDELVRYSSFFFVRDEESKKLLGDSEKVQVRPDLSWLYPLDPALREKERVDDRIALNLVRCWWKNYDPAAWYQTVQPHRVDPFPMYMTDKQDIGLLRELTGQEWDVEYQLTPLLRSNLLVACRYHALVFASMLGIPFVAIAYDAKVERLCHAMGLSDVCLETDQHTALPRTIDYVLNNRSRFERVLENYRRDQSALAREMGNEIRLQLTNGIQRKSVFGSLRSRLISG